MNRDAGSGRRGTTAPFIAAGAALAGSPSRLEGVRRVVATIGATLALLAPGTGLAASAPLVVRNPIDITIPRPLLSSGCGFEVVNRIEGTVTAVLRSDDGGAPIREIDTGLLTFTFFAPSTEKSVSYPVASNLLTDYFPDDTAIATITGLTAVIHERGGAPLHLDVGRTVFSGIVVGVNEDGLPIVEFVDVLSDTGAQKGDFFDAVCAVLAP